MPATKGSKIKNAASNSAKKVAPAARGRGRPAGGATDGAKARKEKKVFRTEDNLKIYIFRVLRDVHPEVGISKSAMTTLNSIILELYRNLASASRELCQKVNR